MAAITLAQAQAKLTEWMAADTAIATAQSYAMGGRTLTRADAAEVRKNIEYWETKVNALSKLAGRNFARFENPT